MDAQYPTSSDPAVIRAEIDFRSRYAGNLSKQLPRIPAAKTHADFCAFSQVGRDLAHWHLNHETVARHPRVAIEETVATC